MAEGAEPRPGAVELVEELWGTVPISIVSNSPRALVEAALGAAVLALSGCKSEILIGQEQSCEVSGKLLVEERGRLHRQR